MLTCRMPAIMSRRLALGSARSFSQLIQVSSVTPAIADISSIESLMASRASEMRPPIVSSVASAVARGASMSFMMSMILLSGGTPATRSRASVVDASGRA
ncbi:hypothetical protein D3C71_1908890 [compost metagenome]